MLARIKHWDQTLREAATFQQSLSSSVLSPVAPAPVLSVSSAAFTPIRAQKPKHSSPIKELFCASYGGNRSRHTCSYRQSVCDNCHKARHLVRVCRSASYASTPPPPQSATSTRAADQPVAAAAQNTGRRPPGGWQPYQPTGRSDRSLYCNRRGWAKWRVA